MFGFDSKFDKNSWESIADGLVLFNSNEFRGPKNLIRHELRIIREVLGGKDILLTIAFDRKKVEINLLNSPRPKGKDLEEKWYFLGHPNVSRNLMKRMDLYWRPKKDARAKFWFFRWFFRILRRAS